MNVQRVQGQSAEASASEAAAAEEAAAAGDEGEGFGEPHTSQEAEEAEALRNVHVGHSHPSPDAMACA
jgi:hypothetical protein